MFNPNDIVLHLQQHIPAFTNLFHSEIAATASASGNTVTFTATGHGLAVGSLIILAGGRTRNTITAGTINADGTTTFETAQDHDQTRPKQSGDQQNLTIADLPESAWNGDFKIVDVPNRRTFEIDTPAGQTTLPTFGNGVLVENNPFLAGLQTVATVPDANSFTITVSGPALPTGTIQDLRVITASPRVFGAANIDKALSSYSKDDATNINPTLYVIIDDTDVSKDRHTLNDGLAGFFTSNLQKQILIQSFSVVAVFPTADQTRGFSAVVQAYTETFRALLSCLYGFEFDDPDAQQRYTTVCAGHGPGVDANAYYTHVYEWQIPSIITFDNGANLEPDVAFRDVDLSLRLEQDDIDALTANIDLDDEPL